MSNIQSSPYPLVFPLAETAGGDRVPAPVTGSIQIRTFARALEGMQKEALVAGVPGARSWRMVCDEGPYLNGTDLAPFPLAFFTAGLVNSYLAEILAQAEAEGMSVGKIDIIQDNFYTMEGSAVRGNMLGGALPVALHVRIDSDVPKSAVQNLVINAMARAPADAFLRGVFESEFAIVKNGKPVPAAGVRAWADSPMPDLSDAMFDAAKPDSSAEAPKDIITKLKGAETVFNAEGGAGSSLKSEQKRTLHVRGIVKLREDGLSETRVQLFKPIGSNFRFLCDVSDPATGTRAPSPLVYLSAGIAFCYLTQIGRYVTILKHDLQRYAIAQDTAFGRVNGSDASVMPPSAEPVRTHVELDTDVDDETAKKIVEMGERTCFLHALSRTPLKTKVRVTDASHPPEETTGEGPGIEAAGLR